MRIKVNNELKRTQTEETVAPFSGTIPEFRWNYNEEPVKSSRQSVYRLPLESDLPE
jgi:hypothetical protein